MTQATKAQREWSTKPVTNKESRLYENLTRQTKRKTIPAKL